jgi:hypothetical protein
VAGIKLELRTTGYTGEWENVTGPVADTNWYDWNLSATIRVDGVYTYRTMVCGDIGAGNTANILCYFDDVNIRKEGTSSDGVSDVTLDVTYAGYSGGAVYTNQVAVYADCLALQGSTANLRPSQYLLTDFRAEAAESGTNAAVDIPRLQYPSLCSEGYPEGQWLTTNYSTYVEVNIPGWKFAYMTNDFVCTATNIIYTYGLGDAGAAYYEFDRYAYVGKMPHTLRNEPLEIDTNAPYFVLGIDDDSSAEFGNGPFPDTHTYVVGTSLTNFPRFMSTTSGDGWPSRLEIIFTENFTLFTNSLWNKHFVVDTVTTNGADSNVKAVKVELYASNDGLSNTVSSRSQEIHMGWAAETQLWGKVDYPNCTYQDHNEVALRRPWTYSLLDDGTGWFMQQRPRGSATIEPIDLYVYRNGSWVPRFYEEYLFGWDAAASGVRSLWDDDLKDRLPGRVSYHIGFKVGHQYGTNALGQPQFPEVINIRGNGYFRMTDYDGVMAGSFRPVAADVFALYADKEDAPLMPAAGVRIVPRTTPSNEPDDSYAQAYLRVHSKTNNMFTSAMGMQMHFTPDEVASNGCYFDLDVTTYANEGVVVSNDGPLSAFAQVSMHWRGGSTNALSSDFSDLGIDTEHEAHDIDAVVLKKADGEWITHQVINPYTNVYHRVLGSFASNDVVYLMQQDRAEGSYGFATEAPYRRASAFEITLLDDGGRDLTLDVYEQYTFTEIADNVDIAANFSEDFSQGEEINYAYRYRSIYAPGVYIINPNTCDGFENWVSNNTYKIEFYATDGHDEPLQADIYYGNGLDSDWTHINTNYTINVSTNTHRVTYGWDVSEVPPGAYYIKVEAQRATGGKTGFDVSNTRLMIDSNLTAFAHNGSTNLTVITNSPAWLGSNMSFETGDLSDWASHNENIQAPAAVSTRAYDGTYAARITTTGWIGGPGINYLWKEIPCVSDEVFRVTGRVYIDSFSQHPTSTSWLVCGIKMESTNAAGRTGSGQEFDTGWANGVWHYVDFKRTNNTDGTDRLMLWLGGHDCTGATIYFDDIKVESTNTGTITTNRIRTGYWEGDSAADVSGDDALRFRLSGTAGLEGLRVWVADSSGTTNSVPVTNYLENMAGFAQPVMIDWTDFASVNKTGILSIGFTSDSITNDVQAGRMQSVNRPLRTQYTTRGAPQVDLEGMPLYNPGETVTNVIEISNTTGADITNVTFQFVHEYGENLYWWDNTHDPAMWSAYTRPGDRLCGDFETVLTNVELPAAGPVTITNVYMLPVGQRVDHTRHALKLGQTDWYFDRNYAAHAQVRMVVRAADGDSVFADDIVACYAMDNDYDIDNDGLPDAYEISNAGSYTQMMPDADSDSDGFSNMDEFIAGTVPTNSASLPWVASSAWTNGSGLEISFSAVTGRLYWLEACTSLTNQDWTVVSTNVDGSGLQTIIDTDAVDRTNRYYKLGIRFHHSVWPQ